MYYFDHCHLFHFILSYNAKTFHFAYVACIIFPLYNAGLVLSICEITIRLNVNHMENIYFDI